MGLADELQKLQQLHDAGSISAEEFAAAKARLLTEPAAPPPPPDPGGGFGTDTYAASDPDRLERETRQWAMILHFSQLAGFVVPVAGLVAPIVIWQVKKSELPGIDAHGKVVTNWILSELIYLAVSTVLAFVLIGIPLLFAVAIAGIIFPIVGGIKASSGELWRYPVTIQFLK